MNKIALAFNEAARFCEHSPEDSTETDLSDLVNSFFEVETDEATMFRRERDVSDGYWSESKTKSMLLDSLSDEKDDVKQMIRKETEHACEMFVGYGLSEEFRCRLMSHVRDNSFDAGLCKSRRDKLGRNLLSEAYEYVDVYTNGTRYIVEVNLVAQFEIARPTTSYASLLEIIPPIFVGKPEELRQVVKLMCKAMRESMKTEDMQLPPWRRSSYMLSKWFSRYKRTVSEVPTAIRRTISFHCIDNFAGKDGWKVGIGGFWTSKEMRGPLKLEVWKMGFVNYLDALKLQEKLEPSFIIRKGEETLHFMVDGPHQAILYPVISLREIGLGARNYVEKLESTMIELSSLYGVKACAGRKGETGVWVGERKIGAIGVRKSHGITSHGLAFNIDPDLKSPVAGDHEAERAVLQFFPQCLDQ
ncbi:hypothetical protein V6N13_084684 [Hibiscus sabdariffa]